MMGSRVLFSNFWVSLIPKKKKNYCYGGLFRGWLEPHQISVISACDSFPSLGESRYCTTLRFFYPGVDSWGLWEGYHLDTSAGACLCAYVLVVLPMHIEQREESAYDVFEIFDQDMDLVFMGAR
jgi:hypothetical protein